MEAAVTPSSWCLGSDHDGNEDAEAQQRHSGVVTARRHRRVTATATSPTRRAAGFLPANPSGTEALDGVGAFAPDDVWAVGFSGVLTATLTEHWNGFAWSMIPSANGTNAASGTNVLKAVTGANGGDVWAVG